MENWFSQHPRLSIAAAVAVFMLWTFPSWLAAMWPMFVKDKTLPEWFAARGGVLGMTSGTHLVISAILTLIVLGVFVAAFLLAPARPSITTANVEENVRAWLDDFGFTVTKVAPPNNDAYFLWNVQLFQSAKMKIARPTAKSMDRYIVVNAGLVIGNNPERLQRLSRNELRRLYRQLTIEMAKTGVEFKIRGELDANQIQNNLIFVEKKIPISETLNRDQFLRDLRDIDYAIVIAQQTIGLAIDDQD